MRVRQWVWLTARMLGALSLLAVGAVHLQQYDDLYSAIPTIGTLFVLNFVAATVLGVGLLVPFELLWRRGSAWIEATLALGGIGVATVAYVFLLLGLLAHLRQHPAPVRLFGCEPYNYPKYARFDHARSDTIADGLRVEKPHPPVQQAIAEAGVTAVDATFA